jgi:hypothetical protein
MITLISILAPIDDQLNFGDNYVTRMEKLSDNPYREGSSVEDYLHNLNIYAQIMKIYVDFFTEYWYEDNVEKTNEKMKERLEKAGIIGWSGLTAEENNSLGKYVLSLDLPIKDSDMKEFFNRVRSGDLEFLCRYPYNGTDAFELLKGVV